MNVEVSKDAAGYIRERGGRLYLWQEAVGNAWAADHLGFDDPRLGIGFIPFRADEGLDLMLADDLEPPESLRVRLRRIPHRGHVEWDGQAWGWRGGANMPMANGG